MEKQLQDLITEQANALINAPMTYEGAKKVAQAWLDAVGTDAEAEGPRKKHQRSRWPLLRLPSLRRLRSHPQQ